MTRPGPPEREPHATILALAAVAVVVALALSAAVAVGSHYDEDDYEAGEASDFSIHTYEGDDADQRQPGADGRSYWTESIVYQIPEDESVYLTESVTYRPMPAACGAENVDVLGIDRDATYEGERRVDEDVTDSIKSYSEDEGARDRYEREAGEYGDLTTADETYVERIEVEWYGPDDIGSPVRIERGDRFVSAQRECFENPDAEGWYRWAAFNEGEFENGSEVSQEKPTFGHWYWICECEDREDAVETLGPPPSERDDGDAEGDESRASGDGGADAGSEPGDDDGETAEDTGGDSTTEDTSDDGSREDDSGDDDPAGDGDTPTAESGATAASEQSSSTTPTPDWEAIRLRTPSEGDGSGFSPGAAVIAILGTLIVARRR